MILADSEIHGTHSFWRLPVQNPRSMCMFSGKVKDVAVSQGETNPNRHLLLFPPDWVMGL